MIRYADKSDLSTLKEFLTKAKLGTDGLSEDSMEYFSLLENESGQLTGTLGIESFSGIGLLRSLVVTPGQAEKDIWLLFGQAIQLAKSKGIKELFLATNKGEAIPLFELLGFKRIQEIPSELVQSDHAQHILSVDNSLFLKFSF